MNKVFKIVWSKSKQCYVVVSEYAKSNGGKKKVLATVLAGLMMAGVGMDGVQAAPHQGTVDTSGSKVNISAYGKPQNTGTSDANAVNYIAIGYQNDVTAATPGQDGRTAIGAGNKATRNSALAIGNQNEATGGASTAIGALGQRLQGMHPWRWGMWLMRISMLLLLSVTM